MRSTVVKAEISMQVGKKEVSYRTGMDKKRLRLTSNSLLEWNSRPILTNLDLFVIYWTLYPTQSFVFVLLSYFVQAPPSRSAGHSLMVLVAQEKFIALRGNVTNLQWITEQIRHWPWLITILQLIIRHEADLCWVLAKKCDHSCNRPRQIYSNFDMIEWFNNK